MQPNDPFQTQNQAQPQAIFKQMPASVPLRQKITNILAQKRVLIPLVTVILLVLAFVTYQLVYAKRSSLSSQPKQSETAKESVTNIASTSEAPGAESPTQKVEAKKPSVEQPKNGGTTKPKNPSTPIVTPPSLPPPPPIAPPSGGYVKPNGSNTGPRYALTRTLTPDQALTELRQKGYLSRVKISGSLKLSGSDGRNWLIEDSVIETSSNYGLQTYTSLASYTGTKAERAIFRYVEIIGSAAVDGSSCGAVVYGSNVVLHHADIYGCDDSVKASSRVDIISSWLHDNDHPSGAHCDSLQIRSGTEILVVGSRFDSYVAYSSDGSQTPSGDTCSGGLQTGSVTGAISARFENNWFAGGHYTIRGYASRDSAYTVTYVFKNNKWMRHGTNVRLGLTTLPPNRYGPITGTLGDFDSSNVWEDTGIPVRN